MKKKYIFIVLILITMAGCQNNSSIKDISEEQKIYIHETTKNYAGLIELYRNQLKNSNDKTDTTSTRFKLAKTYYLSNDYSSAQKALQPVIDKTKDDQTLVLYSRILYKLSANNFQSTIDYLNKAIQINAKNAEAYNLRGIIQINLGQYDAAHYSFNQARDLFYDENKVINNLAMLAILGKDYKTAYQELIILYNKGYRNSTVLHNMLFTLVKLDEMEMAQEFCIKHKMSNNAKILIEELKQIEPNDTLHFNELVPKANQMRKNYSTESKQLASPFEMPNNRSNQSTAIPLSQPSMSIVNIRSGEHSSFSRITIETNKTLETKQFEIQYKTDNLYSIKLFNITLPKIELAQLINKIKKSDRNFIDVTAQYSIDKTLTLNIKVKNIEKYKVFQTGKGNLNNNLVIDFYTVN